MYLDIATRSILSQSFTDFEFIIIDDSSTDASSTLLDHLAREDDRIHIIRNERRLGLTASLNKGLAHCHGEFVARMDSDDVAKPERLALQYHSMHTHPDTAVCGTQGEYINEAGEFLGEKQLPCDPMDIKKKLLWNNQCIHSSLLFRRSVLDDVGGYDEAFKTAQDYELLMRLSRDYVIANIPECGIAWRVRSGSISWQSKRQEWDGLRIRWRAIIQHQYPFWYGCLILLIRSLWYSIPQAIKRRRFSFHI